MLNVHALLGGGGLAACGRQAGVPQRPVRRPAQAQASSGAAAAPPELEGGVAWAAEVTRHTLTLPQVLQHLEQLERIEATAGQPRCGAATTQPPISWVQQGGAAPASLMEGVQSAASGGGDDPIAALAALAPHLLTPAQRAAVALEAWQSAAHTKPQQFDADSQLTLPGLADVAVVSRGGWQRHGWKGCNQDSFLALPLAASSAARRDCADAAACCSSAVAIGVFDGHGRAGQAASAHLRNALASGLLMHSQLALMAQPECGLPGGAPTAQRSASGDGSGSQQTAAAAAEQEAAQLLERCFAAAAATMPSTGADFSLSGSTAVMCLVQPGSVTAAWAGDSRAVLGVCRGGRYLACTLTHDHRPCAPLERARIEAAGGWVMQTMLDEEGRPHGPHRVYLRDTHIPGLAVSRCFGDYVATGAGVTSTPDVTTLVLPLAGAPQQQQAPDAAAADAAAAANAQRRGRGGSRHAQAAGTAEAPAGQQEQQPRRQPGSRRRRRRSGGKALPAPAALPPCAGGQHILVVASDGLWEFVGSSEAVRIASRCSSAQAAAEALAQEARAQWAARFGGAICDDITVAVAFLPGGREA